MAVLGSACSGGDDELATGGGAAEQATTPNGSVVETDPAALAAAIDGIERSTTTTTVPETTLPPTTMATVPPTAPPQTAPPQTAPPQTVPPPPPVDNRTPPTPATGLTADEQQIVNHINTTIGKTLTPEVSLMNAARSGSSSYTGTVSYTFWAFFSVGDGSIATLLGPLGVQASARNFAACTHIGVGYNGAKIFAHCFTY